MTQQAAIMRSPRKYLVLFHTVSCGQNGPGLGSDEQDVVLIVYLVVDLQGNKIIDVKRIAVRPEPLDVNDNILSEEMCTEYNLNSQQIKTAPTLHQVIHDLDIAWRDQIPGGFSLVTDGQLTLRQSLFPEAFRKNLTLPACFHSFHDLRKEFVSVVNCSVSQDTLTVETMAAMLGVPAPNAQDSALRTVTTMASILQRLSTDGHVLHQPETIATNLLQGIRSKGEKVDGNCVVRARGLPWQASDTDIAHFFLGLNIAPGGVALCLSSQGRRNGEALVLFDSVAHRDMALKRHKHALCSSHIYM
jgi:epithelial splicing regulatory protein 1/2